MDHLLTIQTRSRCSWRRFRDRICSSLATLKTLIKCASLVAKTMLETCGNRAWLVVRRTWKTESPITFSKLKAIPHFHTQPDRIGPSWSKEFQLRLVLSFCKDIHHHQFGSPIYSVEKETRSSTLTTRSSTTSNECVLLFPPFSDGAPAGGCGIGVVRVNLA